MNADLSRKRAHESHGYLEVNRPYQEMRLPEAIGILLQTILQLSHKTCDLVLLPASLEEFVNRRAQLRARHRMIDETVFVVISIHGIGALLGTEIREYIVDGAGIVTRFAPPRWLPCAAMK